MATLAFVRENLRFLAFGLLMAFFSSFGQTFYIGAFNDSLREAFDLSAGELGGLYSIATLGSAAALVWTGRYIDDMPLARYATFVAVGLIGACVFMSAVTDIVAIVDRATARLGLPAVVPPALVLGVAYFLLRHFGQGLMGHTSTTSVARRFTARRGRALAIVVLGYPLGQAVLPFLSVALTQAVGWRAAWAVVAGALAIVLVPLIHWLLRGQDDGRLSPVAPLSSAAMDIPSPLVPSFTATTGADAESMGPDAGWTRAEALRDPRFWLVMPAAVGTGFIMTGVFFHQSFIVEQRGWDLTMWTALFALFAAAQIGASLGAGPLVDRLTARSLLPFFLVPMGCGLALLAVAEGTWLAPAFLILAGLSAGFSMTLGGALWAELYGIAHLGAIRSAVSSMGILGTAASPVAMGRLIDAGWSATAMAWMATGYVALAVLGVLVALSLDD